jgi:Spy/CpxP family protein refolding chaperone
MQELKKQVGRNVKTKGYSNSRRLADKARKREQAEARNATWAALTPQQQLEVLDKGGLKATKQRARIAAKLG